MQRRKLEELDLLDDFLWGTMMSHPEFGENFSRMLLKVIFGKDVGKLKVVHQKVLYGRNTELRGARLDVYVEEANETDLFTDKLFVSDADAVYDIEPDKNDKKKDIKALPKRVRFYHAKIDSASLKSGETFENLKKVVVIFITPYDPFGRDRMRYTIANMCREEPEMPYDDGAATIFLYTRGTKGDLSEELCQLLHYMEHTTRKNAVNETLQEMQRMVETVKSDGEVSLDYMKGFERLQRAYDEGREEEMKNTERERKNAEKERENAEKERLRAEAAELKAAEAEREILRLKEMLQKA